MSAYVTTREAAEALGTCVVTMQRHCQKGLIPGARKLAKEWRIPRSWVEGEEVDDETDS